MGQRVIGRGHVAAGLIVLLASGMASAQYRPRHSRNVGSTNSRFLNWTAENYAFFEFAPSSGAGMGTACAGTTPTGAKGEVLTFTRASARSCMKGSESTGIAAGDLVMLTTGQPAVMPGGDGTGGLGLGVWEARTNSTLHSEAINPGVVWAQNNSGAAATTVTQDYAQGPCGAWDGGACFSGAERLQIPAVTAAQYSQVYQLTACPAGTQRHSIFARTVDAGTGVLCIGMGTNHEALSFDGGLWTRLLGTQDSAGTTNLSIGSDGTSACGAAPAQDVLVWGSDCENGATVSPYIKTEGTAQTRVVEVASFALPVAMSASTGSHAATVMPTWGTTNQPSLGFILVYDAAAEPIFTENASNRSATYDGTNQVSANTTLWTAGSATRLWSSYTGSTQTINNGSATQTGTFDGTMGSAALSTLYVGSRNGTGPINAVVKKACADSSPTRCR